MNEVRDNRDRGMAWKERVGGSLRLTVSKTVTA